MHRNLFALVLVASLAPLCAEAVTADMFRVRSTADLVEICSVPPNDAMHAAAIGFCHGYGVGAFHYYQASVSGPEGKPFVCLPDPPPSRTGEGNRPKGGGGGGDKRAAWACPLHHASHGPPPPLRGGGC